MAELSTRRRSVPNWSLTQHTFHIATGCLLADLIANIYGRRRDAPRVRYIFSVIIRLPGFSDCFSGSIYTVRRFANEVVGPRVREMDENENMDPAVIKGLFEQGVSCQGR